MKPTAQINKLLTVILIMVASVRPVCQIEITSPEVMVIKPEYPFDTSFLVVITNHTDSVANLSWSMYIDTELRDYLHFQIHDFNNGWIPGYYSSCGVAPYPNVLDPGESKAFLVEFSVYPSVPSDLVDRVDEMVFTILDYPDCDTIFDSLTTQHTTTSVDHYRLRDIDVYPTLVSDVIHVHTSTSENMRFSIIDLLGVSRLNDRLVDQVIDVQGLGPGQYVLLLEDGQSLTCRMILKQ